MELSEHSAWQVWEGSALNRFTTRAGGNCGKFPPNEFICRRQVDGHFYPSWTKIKNVHVRTLEWIGPHLRAVINMESLGPWGQLRWMMHAGMDDELNLSSGLHFYFIPKYKQCKSRKKLGTRAGKALARSMRSITTLWPAAWRDISHGARRRQMCPSVCKLCLRGEVIFCWARFRERPTGSRTVGPCLSAPWQGLSFPA